MAALPFGDDGLFQKWPVYRFAAQVCSDIDLDSRFWRLRVSVVGFVSLLLSRLFLKVSPACAQLATLPRRQAPVLCPRVPPPRLSRGSSVGRPPTAAPPPAPDLAFLLSAARARGSSSPCKHLNCAQHGPTLPHLPEPRLCSQVTPDSHSFPVLQLLHVSWDTWPPLTRPGPSPLACPHSPSHPLSSWARDGAGRGGSALSVHKERSSEEAHTPRGKLTRVVRDPSQLRLQAFWRIFITLGCTELSRTGHKGTNCKVV